MEPRALISSEGARVACGVLARLATSSIVVFVDELERDAQPLRACARPPGPHAGVQKCAQVCTTSG